MYSGMVKLLFHADERSGIRVLTLPGRFFVFKKDIMKVMYRFSFSFFSLLFFCFFFAIFLSHQKVVTFNLKKLSNRVSIKIKLTAILRYALAFLIHVLAYRSL